LVDVGLPARVDHPCQASDPKVVDSCVPPQVQQPPDDFLTAIQTYHLEFDVENVLFFYLLCLYIQNALLVLFDYDFVLCFMCRS
jgi:hypothetical protein